MLGRRISHYLIERALGRGGMGEVYLARDLALARATALKLLPDGLDADSRARFLREARTAARLQHPAIVTFYEAGEFDGIAFLAMEYVPGETLRQRLAAGALPPAQALAIVGSTLEGLVHAHAAGVLHRDIKPANIMVTAEGLGRLLDFGIAKRLVREDDPTSIGETLATEAGAVLGTAGYLSPEQARGEPLDERTDVFAAAAVLYEALAGRPAFPGGTVYERIAAVLAGPPPPLEPAVGLPGIDAALARALARERGQRHAGAAELLRDLQDLSSGVPVSVTPDTLAVMDLENASGDPTDAWIGSAAGEQLTGELARVPGLEVVARERVLRARAERSAADLATDALETARALGCRWLLSGSYQRVGPALRFTTRLTDVSTARVAASQKLDGTLEGIFALQDALAEAVVKGLPATFVIPARAPRTTPRVDAYELYATGGRLFDQLQKGSFADAQRMFEAAIAADPRFAPPYGGLAAIHAMHFTYMTDRRELERAEAYGRRALELDPGLGRPHIWLGYACWRQGRLEEALSAFEWGRRLEPESAYGDYFAGCALWSEDRGEEALPHLQRAVQVDPQHGFSWLALGALLTQRGMLDEAAWALERAIALEGRPGPGPSVGAKTLLGEVLRRQDRLAEARQACMAGIDAIERSDHMYRDSSRAIGLLALGRVALDQGDLEAAAAAYRQAATHLRGRPRTLGGRHLLVQALAGSVRAGGDRAVLDEARALLEGGEAYDGSWLWYSTRQAALEALAAAADGSGTS